MKHLPASTVDEIEDFFSNYPLRKYKKGQILVLPGERAEYAYLLVEGRLRLYDTSYRGDEIIIDMFKSPAFFPLPLIMNESPSFLYHEADTDIVVRQAPVLPTQEFLNTHPAIVLDLLTHLYQKFDDALRRMVRLMASSAKVRLVYEIVAACGQIGEVQPDGSYLLKISQSKLGARIGLARETVTREIKSLKDKGLLEASHTHIIVPDMEKLQIYLDTHK